MKKGPNLILTGMPGSGKSTLGVLLAKALGRVIYLKLDLATLTARINNIKTRGIVKAPGQTLGDVFRMRMHLYEKYADVTIDCPDKGHEQIVKEIINGINES